MDDDKNKDPNVQAARNLIRLIFVLAGIGMILYGMTHGAAGEHLSGVIRTLIKTLGLG